MSEGMELALGAMLFYGLADWVYKRAAQSGVQAHHFLALQAFVFGLARRIGQQLANRRCDRIRVAGDQAASRV